MTVVLCEILSPHPSGASCYNTTHPSTPTPIQTHHSPVTRHQSSPSTSLRILCALLLGDFKGVRRRRRRRHLDGPRHSGESDCIADTVSYTGHLQMVTPSSSTQPEKSESFWTCLEDNEEDLKESCITSVIPSLLLQNSR